MGRMQSQPVKVSRVSLSLCLQLDGRRHRTFGSVHRSQASPWGRPPNTSTAVMLRDEITVVSVVWVRCLTILSCPQRHRNFTAMDPPETTTQQETGKGGGSTGSSFQSALTALKSTHQPSLSSNRNAGGGLPPVPKAWANDSRTEGENSVASSKPVNRPASSKNAIVHSVLQVR